MWISFVVFVVVVIVLPTVYGWVYRGWGPPPWPTMSQLRGEQQRQSYHEAEWRFLGAGIWFCSFIAILWLLALVLR